MERNDPKYQISTNPMPTKYSWVITPNYSKQARKLSKKKKKPTPPPNPNERQPFHAGLKFRQDVSTQRTFDAALGHLQKTQRLHRKRDVAHEQETVFLTSFAGTNNEIPSPILKRKNWFFDDEFESRPASQDKNTQGGYVASSPIKKERKDEINDAKNIRNIPKKNIHSPELVSLVREMNLSTEVNVDTKTKEPSPKYEPTYENKQNKKEKKNSPELVPLLREVNLSTEVKLDTQTKVPTPKYEPTYEDQENKKKANDEKQNKKKAKGYKDQSSDYEKYIKSVSLGEMLLPTEVNEDTLNLSTEVNVDTKMKVPPPKYKHTYEYQENKKKAKKDKKIKKKTKDDNDDSDYDIVIESVTYV